eukprot:TRINITY_DN15058_c0_g1::TRINITY_DN15058_c0_g1_i1::g.24939::m.24939 TRINITY_DN15058_c0_g1::TRINITY_DN15058_c0_g1_i1::g.24939  ORF type:complete len:323 (+),score=84.18,sp/B5FZ19/EIF3I_TAEGU/45.96/9e-111,WD40/PF00400.27/0.7,WD40/PF00400.27/1.5e-08,WD40/PF00400.27/26,WD40/PF00400.27/1.7e-05,WD40/PF00400.27/0.0052,WD40/PF00400.27/2.8e+02,WD40/PF00400.27/4.8e-08,Nucleoporin_N/PF08801.6/1.4,Nucleoporin_N/PF08801.6/4.8,PD40/PF07676.7/2.5e+03,PD40/PF07676.7/4e+02,PD40/PF07676.7/1,FAD_binding_8/PF08022.7/
MRPYLLKGHERPLTCAKYSREGDIVFTTAKDTKPTAWWAETGERIGTYNGHNGAVWAVDVDYDTKRIVTGSADNTAKIWVAETGQELYTFHKKTPVRSVAISPGDKLLALVTTSQMGYESSIQIHPFAQDTADQTDEVVMEMKGHTGIITHVVFDLCNRWILSCGEDATVRKWDIETGQEIGRNKDHQKGINDMQLNKEGTMFITASSDYTSRLFDPRTMETVKIYRTQRPVNAAAISPLMDHIALGGGQEAKDVTTTSNKVGQFQVRVFHKIFEDEIGTIKGHFGPINCIAFSPDGRSFVSGAEDGYARLHHFDPSYFQLE